MAKKDRFDKATDWMLRNYDLKEAGEGAKQMGKDAINYGKRKGKEFIDKYTKSDGDYKPSTGLKEVASPSGFKKGGMVKKTGLALVHKGEKVLTAKQVKSSGGKSNGKAKKR